MFANFLTVGQQVIILFILVAVGFVCGKTRLISDDGVKSMTDFVLYIVTPCVIVRSFCRSFDYQMLKGLLTAALCAVFVHLGSVLLAMLCIRDKDKQRQCVLRFSSVFSNCGFMSLPLQQALLGDNGVFYGAVYVAVFNLFIWSYGVYTMSDSHKGLSLRKIAINPGTVGIAVGLPIFLLSLNLPAVVYKPVDFLSALNTPVPMVIIGFNLAKASLGAWFKDAKCLLSIALRLIVIPALALCAMYAMNVRGDILVSCVIGASAPVAAMTAMFALKFDKSPDLAVRMVSLSTVLSVITMPIIVGAAQFIA